MMNRLRHLPASLFRNASSRPSVTLRQQQRQTEWRLSSDLPHRSRQHPRRNHRLFYGVVGACTLLTTVGYYSYDRAATGGQLDETTKSSAFIHDAYKLHFRVPFSQSSALFTLKPTNERTHAKHTGLIETGQIWGMGTWSLNFVQPEIQIFRAYTPLPSGTDDVLVGNVSLNFLIRKNALGEMSQFLSRLSLGATVPMQGPVLDYELPKDITDVVFLAGGTGIAPAMQVAFAIKYRHTVKDKQGTSAFSDSSPIKMSILWANRTSTDAYGLDQADYPGKLVKQINSIGQSPALNLDLKVFVDEQKQRIEKRDLASAVASSPSPGGKRVIIISGPDGFVRYLAGSKALPHEVDRHRDGVPGGMLSQIDLRGWEVIKLPT